MSVIDTRTVLIVPGQSIDGGLTSFTISTPRSVILRPPKSIKVLTFSGDSIDNPISVLLQSRADNGNYHFIVSNPDATIEIDIFMPNCEGLYTLATDYILPASQGSGVAPNPVTSNVDIATLFTNIINLFTTPVAPVGIGTTFTVTWEILSTYTTYFRFRSTLEAYLDFNVYDSVCHLIGFHKTKQHIPQNTLTIISPTVHITDYTTILNWKGGATQNIGNYAFNLSTNIVSGVENGIINVSSELENLGICESFVVSSFEKSYMPFISIKNSRYYELFTSGVGVYEPLQLVNDTNLAIKFNINMALGGLRFNTRISDYGSNGVSIIMLFNFAEATTDDIVMI